MPKVKTIILDGTETAVKFEKGYPYYVITNMGENELYASGSPGITAYADGVYTILLGTETRISPELSADTVYLLGGGTVQVRAEEIAVPTSFNPAGKGGGSGGVTDYSLLENKPSINGITLNENKSLKNLGINNFDGRYTSLSSLPMCWSDLGGNFYGGVWIRACTIQPLGSFPIGSFSMLFFVEEWQQDSYVASITFSERNESNIKILSSTKNILQHLPKIRIVFNSNVIHVDVYYAAAIDHVRFSVLLPPGRLYVSSFPFTYNPSANGFYVQEFALKRDTVTVDTSLSETSENPVQNKVVAAAVNELSQRISLLEQKE